MATVKDLCEKHYDKWIYDCSGFLKAVAGDLKIKLTGNANAIVDTMEGSSWMHLKHDAKSAANFAGLKYLVVAGLKASGHGHVAIIVPGKASTWPYAYWGSIGKTPGRNKTINWSWPKSDLKKVNFYAMLIPGSSGSGSGSSSATRLA